MRRRVLFVVVFAALFVEITSCGGGGSSSAPPPPVNVTVTVSPSSAIVGTFGTTSFSATVQGSSNQAVTWEVNAIAGGNSTTGTISTSGVYQAPQSVPVNTGTGDTTTVSVTAVSQANSSDSGFATVTVTSANQLAQALPVALGTSGGNINDVDTNECAGGTIGSLVVANGTQYILSNNHVLADEDAGTDGQAIIQPSLIDTPEPCSSAGSNTVAHLSQFIELEQPSGCTSNCTPPADAAIAQVVSDAVDANGTIIQLGGTTNGSGVPTDEPPSTTIFPVANIVPNSTAVAKSGRSTGLTCSLVGVTDLTVMVDYTHGLGGSPFTATYDNQIEVNGGTFSAAGDSGSLIVAQSNARPVALLYAGNSTSTVGAPVQTALTALDDLLDPSAPPNLTFVGTSDHAVAGCTSSGSDSFNPSAQTAASQPSSAQLSAAEAVKNENATVLMSDPAVLAVGVAGSLDRPDHAAIVLFLRKGQQLVRAIPASVSGFPTRVVSVDSLPQSGAISQQSTAAFIKSAGAQSPARPTQQALAAAKAVKEKYASSLMKQPGILGVGVTSSFDNPSDAAILIFVQTGKTHNPIPLELDGVRVRVQSTDRFRAYGWGHPKAH
jgi:hypothetical protein